MDNNSFEEKSNKNLNELIEDKQAQTPEDPALFKLFREQLKNVLNTLTSQEKEILRLRFGLVDGFSWTLKKTAQAYGITPERVRQIDFDALSRLKSPIYRELLEDYIV